MQPTQTRAERWLAAHGYTDPPPTRVDPERRDHYIREFGFSIRTTAILWLIAREAPLHEVGAGSGYWSRELLDTGVDVIAPDPSTWPVFMTSKRWCRIERMTGQQAVREYPDRNLSIVWPPVDEDWPGETLEAFDASAVVYIGEPESSALSGTAAFHKFRRTRFCLDYDTDVHRMTTFIGFSDPVFIFRR